MVRKLKDIELLAPAGGWEQLEYALLFGADAVYLAADRFGMRQRAENFRLQDLARAVSLAHGHGSKVHVTCNTVMHDADIEALPRFFECLEASGADAVIIGDLGALRLARRHAPSVAVHISTQASVSNAESAMAFYELGAKRIVCAREMSLDSIAKMRSLLPQDLELEAFAHGSMCMAYSGRCLISDYVNGRSALSGHCTQPCRWSYALVEEKRSGEYFPVEETREGTYILNSKDLNMIGHLDDMAAAGIDSVKIEGRNKKASYVATVVNAYRHVIDGESPRVWARELEKVSHRPYSTGFFYGPAHQTPESIDYLRAYEMAATVVESRPAEGGLWDVEVVCRNRFCPGDSAEAIAPHMPVTKRVLGEIRHVEDPEFAPELETAVTVANRTNDHYRFIWDEKLPERAMIHVERRARG